MIQLENTSNYNHDAFCKPSHLKNLCLNLMAHVVHILWHI